MNDRIVQLKLGPVWARFFGSETAVGIASALLTVDDPKAKWVRKGNWQWDGKVPFFSRTPTGFTFLSGLAWRLKAELEARDYVVTIVDDQPKLGKAFTTKLAVDTPTDPTKRIFDGTFGDHQLKAIEHAIAVRRCALQCPTGGGKTLLAAEIIRQTGFQTLWMVSGDRLIDQTIATLKLRLPKVTVGKYGKGKKEPGSIIVGSVKTLLTIPESDPFWARFELLIIDEAHHAGADTWSQVAQRVPAWMRIAMSGTITTRKADPVRDRRIEGVTGPTFEVIDHQELINAGFLAKPKVVFLRPDEQSYPHYTQIRDMVIPRWRDKPQLLATQGHRLHALTYEKGIVENSARNLLILRTAQLHALAREKVVVLLTRIAHAQVLAEILRRYVQNRFPVWALDGQAAPGVRDQVLGALAKTTTTGCVLFATPFFREGLDIPEIDVLMLAGGGKSDVALLQGVGRVLRPRPDKDECLIYSFWDGVSQDHRGNYLKNHTLEQVAVFQSKKFEVVLP